jgi:hypothetical protein
VELDQKVAFTSSGCAFDGAPCQDRHLYRAERFPEVQRVRVHRLAAHTFIEVGPFVEFDQRSDSAGAEPPADELCPAEVFDRIAEVGHLPVKYACDPGLVVEEVPGAKVTVDDCGSFRWCRWVSGQPAEGTLEGCGRGSGSLLQGSCPAADLGRGKLIGLGARAEQVGGRDDGVDIGKDPGLLLGEFLAFCLVPGGARRRRYRGVAP